MSSVVALRTPSYAQPALARLRHSLDVVTHLVWTEYRLRYRKAVFGWLWAIAQPLARFVVMAFLFSRILPLGIPHYRTYLFTGLVLWQWFAAGTISACDAVVNRSDLLLHPGTTRLAGPIVAVLTDFLDVVAALPVVLLFAVLDGGLRVTALLLPVLLLLELGLILGVGLLLCSANVWVRDVRQFANLGVLLGFYVTPVFYRASSIPERYRSLFALNPMSTIIAAGRDLLAEGRLPPGGDLLLVTAETVLLLVLGLAIYLRASRTFVDQL